MEKMAITKRAGNRNVVDERPSDLNEDQEWGKMAEKTLTKQEAQFELRGRETTNARGMNKEIRNWQNLTDVEEEIDEFTNHQN
ncbi:hypothetical protein TIFTF001_023020 [Ficus carica]|uniref:Uncharacterized protein n=1 Tax=Ficus carica TaxID=3494 RepID=A0AA88DF06_FICCA|nr:hypothetical protein TIFTF001_023020 [Ficus carica]